MSVSLINSLYICLQELRIISFSVLNMSKLDLGRFFTINNCNFSVMFTTENQGLSVVLDGRYIGYQKVFTLPFLNWINQLNVL